MPEQDLHDRATRGEALSAEESARLQDWYARLDREEAAFLDRRIPSAELTALRGQVEVTLAQVAAATQHIQTLSSDIAAIRREIASLQALLAQRLTTQSA